MSIPFSWRTMAIGLLLVSVVVAGRIASHYRNNYLQVQQHAEQQKKTLAQQAELLATMRADDARNRALMEKQQQREQQVRQQGQDYQRKYREAIKNDDCANRDAPGPVIDLLRGTDTGASGAARSAAP
ncbi:hypothetical protein HF675_13475 [Serratia sp. JUb9]|uniref:hypothetical protein n=1 Tax=Serratia sp. JUb9 TaxID=2724469 RepID=UPI00164D245E|nr:hypothetical protein [Serratia sp. JUb9]QNK30661.1 hypothetical protein HF675_13475 [Serratia sp. JUb9]